MLCERLIRTCAVSCLTSIYNLRLVHYFRSPTAFILSIMKFVILNIIVYIFYDDCLSFFIVAVILANPFEVLFLIRHPASITAIKICSTWWVCIETCILYSIWNCFLVLWILKHVFYFITLLQCWIWTQRNSEHFPLCLEVCDGLRSPSDPQHSDNIMKILVAGLQTEFKWYV